MPSYPTGQASFDRDHAEQHRAEIDRAVSVTASDPAFLYLTKVRGIPAEVVLGCADLRMLPAPIPGRDRVDFACISLLRPTPNTALTGAELAFVDALGHPAALEPRRVQWRFTEHGCRDSWFWAGGSGDTAVVVEGFCAKPLALLAAGVPGLVLGWGARPWLRHKKAGLKKLVIIADRRPAEGELSEDGKPLRDQHDREYRRGADRWLLRGVEVLVTPDPGPLGKDADEILISSGAEALRTLVEAAAPAALSQDGWAFKLGLLTDSQYELARERLAREYAAAFGGGDGGKVRLAFLDAQREQGKRAVFLEATRERGQDGTGLDLEDLGIGNDDDKRSRLVAIATEADLFADDGGDGYAVVTLAEGALRTFKIEGVPFTDWLIAEYGRRFPEFVAGRQVPGSVSSSTLADAARTVLAVARQGDVRKVFLRLGWAQDRLWLDMALRVPRALEITPDGWSIIQDPPVHLVFSPTAKPLPVPVPGPRKAVLRQLRRFFGFRLKDDRLILLLGMMLAALMPRGPYPILILSGEQGSGKTTRYKLIKLAIDPTKASVRGRPRSAEDLAISVWRSWLGLFDNLSKLDQDMSDWLCRLSEGAGLPKRKLYTDSEEIVIEAARPIMLTAIPDIAQSGDVIDRSVLIRCDPLQTKVREQVLLDQFEEFRPRLLGYLVEAASCALRRYTDMVDTHDGLRRGDWCAWVEAAAPALGLPEGEFTAAYRRNQEQAVRMALELDPVAAAVLTFMEDKTEIELGVTLLHSALEQIARKQHTGRLPLDWPSMSHHFSGRLRRVAPMLRRVGIEFQQDHKRNGSVIRLGKLPGAAGDVSRGASEFPPESASPASPASQQPGQGNGCDAGDASDAENPQNPEAAPETLTGNGASANAETAAPLPPKRSRIRRGKSA